MDITHCVAQYGYVALIIDSLAEGEAITLLGGVTAHQGVLEFPLMVFSIALGGMIGDQLLYLLERRFGDEVLRRFSRHQARIHYAQKMIQRRPYLFAVGTRFMHGFRVIGPLLVGASHLLPKIFLPLGIFGAFVWALLFTTLGYVDGEVTAPRLHSLDQHIKYGIRLALVIGIVAGVRWWMERRSIRKTQWRWPGSGTLAGRAIRMRDNCHPAR